MYEKNGLIKTEIEILKRSIVFEKNFPKPDKWVIKEIEDKIKDLKSQII